MAKTKPRTAALKADTAPLDRRQPAKKTERRGLDERRRRQVPTALDRRKTDRRNHDRRRQVDPTTCERDYTDEELAFMAAVEGYKREFARPFPTWSEILEVLKSLGYRRVVEPISIVQNRAKSVMAHDDEEDED